MTRRGRVLAAVLTAACAFTPHAGAYAQRAWHGDTLSKRATSDSLAVFRQYQKRVKAIPRDAAAQFRLGRVAAALAAQSRERYLPPGLTRNELDATAYNSLKAAASIDSANPRYLYELAPYMRRQSFEGHSEYTATFERVIQLSRAANDTALLVDALMELGSMRFGDWYTRDQSVDESPSRLPAKQDEPAPIADGVRIAFQRDAQMYPLTPMSGPSSWDRPLRGVAEAAGKDSVKFIGDVMRVATERVEREVGRLVRSGVTDASRRRIEQLFEEAFSLRRDDPRAFVQLATLYAAGGEWARLAVAAREQTRRTPRDARAWMALGLANQRMGLTGEAEAAFATGLARLKPKERSTFDRLERVLTWYDSTQYALHNTATRNNIAERTWMFADPLWSVDDGNPRQEFLARIAYADLRWPRAVHRRDDDTTTVSGADTRMGDVYVRYGPPNAVRGGFWLYDAGLIFSAGAGAKPRRVQEGLEFDETTERAEDWQPARWDNVTLLRVDSMPSQIARFRGAGDSVDVYLAARTTVGGLPDSVGHASVPAAHFWFVDEETLRPSDASGRVDSSGVLTWTRRLAQGTYHYRAEVTAPRVAIAGRASGSVIVATDTVTGFSTSGFGISDPLFATNVVAPSTPRRWTDVAVTPLTGTVAQGSAISIVWENYDLGEREGNAEYAVKLVVERKYLMFLNKVRARVISAWAAMMGSEQTSDRVIFRYDRTAAHANAIADVVTLALEDTPPGNYDLTLEITDKVTGKIASRTTRVVIRD